MLRYKVLLALKSAQNPELSSPKKWSLFIAQTSVHYWYWYRSCLKFIYSEKGAKFGKISTVDLTVTTQDKSTVEISQKFVAFSEYMNFNTSSFRVQFCYHRALCCKVSFCRVVDPPTWLDFRLSYWDYLDWVT